MSKHTPGEWRVHTKAAFVVPAGYENAPTHDCQPICALLWPTPLRSEAETRANATLMAAAPAMIEVLRECRHQFWEDNHSHMSEERFAKEYAWLDLVIARAEGRL
ncbi:MAG: hypothetical protein KF765_12395 [Parvibaculaceae bacterium]|nr:hypothetical protein [Parvibaculaceae bacterium]